MVTPSFTPDFALADVSSIPSSTVPLTPGTGHQFTSSEFLAAERCNIPRFLLVPESPPADIQSPCAPSTLHAADKQSTDSRFPPDVTFRNPSIRLLMEWTWGRSPTKSQEEINSLVHDVLRHRDFKISDLDDFDVRRETARLDAMLAEKDDGWKESTIEIKVPDGKPHKDINDPPVPVFHVPGLQHRSIVEVIKSAWSCATSSDYHYTPFRQYWSREDGSTERVHDELYASEAFNSAYEDLQRQPAEEGCTLERVVCGLMFWSDSTHLASFGNASLWPLYMYFGNQSKYTRCKPSSSACHHIAYIPKLPDTFFDFVQELSGGSNGPAPEVLTHCRRELMHAVWCLLLDKEFLHAYKHGIVILCADGILRRVYPRIFTYSADYPEKVLLATIRNLGSCPCPRCTISIEQILEMGMKRDDTRREKQARQDDHTFRWDANRAHEHIYENGRGVKSTVVENLLGKKSYVPTKNAFSEKLSEFGFDLFSMFVVDFMHEVELGVWKAFLLHLLRMLVCVGYNMVQQLNQRYRMIPSYSRSTIRRFHSNVSEMKKLAARDFEDLLQCAMPVFEGLFPESDHDRSIQDLLFILADWHACAKLRMHTDTSIGMLRNATTLLGAHFRAFVKNICPKYDTKELPKETAARGRRLSRKRTQGQARQAQQAEAAANTTAGAKTIKRKLLNLLTYKYHSLGDYVRNILMFGTTDSYSTQIGELQHRRVKRFYARTNKIRTARQIARLNERARALRSKAELNVRIHMQQRSHAIPTITPDMHHWISHSRHTPLLIYPWFRDHCDHPALKDFIVKLKNHLLGRIRKPNEADDGSAYSAEERRQVIIQNDRIYRHRTFRVNYTTYDLRREHDSMNPRNHADIMTLSHDVDPNSGTSLSGHPFAYARLLDIYHVPVVYCPPAQDPICCTFEVLFVRHYRLDTRWKCGFQQKKLPRLRFVPADDTTSFGFLDPDEVIRGAHIIPAFAHGKSDFILDHTPFKHSYTTDHNWQAYYVNWFVDRDMYMRYRGCGVGHRAFKVDDPPVEPSTDDLEIEDDDSEDNMPLNTHTSDVVASVPTEPAVPSEQSQANITETDSVDHANHISESRSGSSLGSSTDGDDSTTDSESGNPSDGEGPRDRGDDDWVDEEEDEEEILGFSPL
ncbi:hypothetical protein K474DRAFT_1603363 [Panus rudis PR-1116 ss-1]|nr:hypothetical protein K474DRAFT_1603363 [Panus rudis PR-1116 ss-1]